MVIQFPLDYMHLTCFGVVKKMTGMWMGVGMLRVQLGSNTIRSTSEAIIMAQSYLPKKFGGKGCSLEEVDRWKATKFRSPDQYTGPVILKGMLSDICTATSLCYMLVSVCCVVKLYLQSSMIKWKGY